MIPIHLSLSGFLSYREPAEIDFRTFDLACIAGSNGAGKSSILDAITWALFGIAPKRDDSMINTSSDFAQVEFIFSYEGNYYRIQRSKKRAKAAALEFQILQNLAVGGNEGSEPTLDDLLESLWKPLTERSMRETQARIQDTLRMDYDTFVNASFFLQGKADQFTQHRPADRKKILGSILGLEVWETYRKRAAERRKILENEVAGIDGRIQEILAELAEEQQRKQRLGQLEKDLERIRKDRAAQEVIVENFRRIKATLVEQEKLVEALTRQLEAGEKRFQSIETRIEGRSKERENYQRIVSQGKQIEEVYQSWQALKVDLENWENVAVRFREEEKRRAEPLSEIRAARARLEQEQKSLLDDKKAFTAAASEIDRQRNFLEQVQSEITAAEKKLSQRVELESQLQHAHKNQAEARAENPRLKTEMDELKERIEKLEEAHSSECPVCGQPLNPEERKALIEDLTVQGTELGDRYRANTALVRETDEKVQYLSTQITSLGKVDEELRAYTQKQAGIKSSLELLENTRTSWEETYEPHLIEIQAALEKEQYAPEAYGQLAKIDEELKRIGYDAAAHEAVRRAEKEGRASEEQMRTLETARASLQPIERELSELETQAAELEGEISRMRLEQSDAAAALAAAQAQAPDLESAERDKQVLQERENQITMEMGGARQAVLVLDDLRARMDELEEGRERLAGLVGQHRSLERAFGPQGVPALLIEQALPQIEQKANEILEKLGGDMSVSFLTQTAFKDKKREDKRETLDIQIRDGAGGRDYEMFSGGEAFRVNFAIRLALSEMLAQRAGARLQTLVIDEGFGTQDAQGRQRLIEAINTVRTDFAKILVITHIDELKEAFPTRIEVQKTIKGSSIQVI